MKIFSNILVTNFKKRSKIKGFIAYYVGSSPIFRISSMSGENPRSLEFIKVSGFYFSPKILLIVIIITHSNKIFSNFLVTVFSNKKRAFPERKALNFNP